MTKPPTLNDVAKAAKVSRSLASLVFQNSTKVSENSRQAVLRAADKLGYQPNESARRLKSNKTSTIGVVLTDIHNPYYGEIFYGVEGASSKSEYKLLIGNSGFETDEENQITEKVTQSQVETIQTLRSQMIDGLICSSVSTTPEELTAASRGLPVVLIGHTSASLTKKFDVVSSDETFAAEKIIGHLTELGHKRIAHISGGKDEGPAKRTKAYLSQMKKFQLSSYAQVLEGNWTETAGYDNTEILLNQKFPPTAIYAASDLIAAGVLSKLRERNLRVPEDISVVGYDDSTFAKLRIANLTSVREPLHEMGIIGFHRLIELIQREDSSKELKNIKIKPELKVRGSTARVKNTRNRRQSMKSS